MIKSRTAVLFTGISLSLMLSYFTKVAWDELSAIEARQTAANERLSDWKSQYEPLIPVNDRWKKEFVSEGQAKDLLRLYKLANIEQHGLSADVDLVKQSLSIPVLVNGMEVGLTKLCLATEGSSLVVRAPSIKSLRLGLHQLSQRSDISLGSLSLSFDDETGLGTASINPFCVLVRTDAQAVSTIDGDIQ